MTRFLFRSNAAPVTATGVAQIYFHGRVRALLFSHGFATLESFYPLFRTKNGQAARKYSGSLPRAFPFTLSRSYVFVRARRGHTNRAEDVRLFGDARFRARPIARGRAAVLRSGGSRDRYGDTASGSVVMIEFTRISEVTCTLLYFDMLLHVTKWMNRIQPASE